MNKDIYEILIKRFKEQLFNARLAQYDTSPNTPEQEQKKIDDKVKEIKRKIARLKSGNISTEEMLDELEEIIEEDKEESKQQEIRKK